MRKADIIDILENATLVKEDPAPIQSFSLQARLAKIHGLVLEAINAFNSQGSPRLLRPDVLHFALLMSQIMDAKEREKGPINGGYTLQKALMNLESQWNKMREMPTPQGEELRRILVHLANFAMIAESKVDPALTLIPLLQELPREEKFYRRCQSKNTNGVQCGQSRGHEGKHKLGESVEPW